MPTAAILCGFCLRLNELRDETRHLRQAMVDLVALLVETESRKAA
jgi:hypothetical protein